MSIKLQALQALSQAERDDIANKTDPVVRLQMAVETVQDICKASSNVSQYFPFGGEGYKASVRHYFESSSDIAYAAVQPGRIEDVVDILQVLAITKTQFAVKGGGHTTNPKFSSTNGGIQISMARFNEIAYDANTKALTVGAGCLFDEVYRFLKPLERNIVGGSAIAGVGVAGWLLGGGYSLKTNQFGLGIDNLLGVKIVLPNGTVEDVSAENKPELFQAVKGGGNNFGIVVQFTLKTHPQSLVYGDVLEYKENQVEAVKEAVIHFVDTCEDPKAAIVAAFRYFNSPGGEKFKLTLQYFYDSPTPTPNPFDRFLDIKPGTLRGQPGESKESDDSLRESSYFDYDHTLSVLFDAPLNVFDEIFERGQELLDEFFNILELGVDAAAGLVAGLAVEEAGFANVASVKDGEVRAYMAPQPPKSMAGVGENARGRWGNVMVAKYTREVIDEVDKQAKEAASYMKKHSGKIVIVEAWPFLSQMFDKSTPAAWPHKKGEPNGPLLVLFQWEGEENDRFWISRMNKALDAIEKKVYGIGVKPTRPIYSNTSLADRATVQEVYRENLESLSLFRKKIDPYDVMGQAGGYKIPLAP